MRAFLGYRSIVDHQHGIAAVGLHRSGSSRPPPPQWTGHPPRASNDLVEKYLRPKIPKFQGSDRNPIGSHRAALSPALLRSIVPTPQWSLVRDRRLRANVLRRITTPRTGAHATKKRRSALTTETAVRPRCLVRAYIRSSEEIASIWPRRFASSASSLLISDLTRQPGDRRDVGSACSRSLLLLP